MPPVCGRDVLPGAVRRSGVLACQTSRCTPDVGIPVLTCHLTGARDSAGKGSTSPVGDGVLHFLSTRRVWCRCRRSSTIVFHVFPPSCYPDAMKKSITVLPRDPDILSPEITSTVYQLWSYTRVRSGLLLCVSSWSLLGLPVIVSPVTTSHQMLPLDYGTAGVDHRRQPECSYYPG